MSNPTTPFSWQMPQNTDLVTDLPADFEVFGQAVATSMADLLGGTTGQVLAKTSATDMDFTWTTPQVGDITGVTAGTGISGGGTSGTVTVTNSMATAITTNGDIIYGTGSGTFNRLGIGTTGQVLTVAGGIPSYATLSTGAYTLLSTTTLTSTSTTVSSISGSYTDLMVIINNPYFNVAAALKINPNATVSISFNSGTQGGTAVGNDEIQSNTTNLLPIISTPVNAFALYIRQYAGTTFGKPFQFHGTGLNANNTNNSGGAIRTTSAITSLQFTTTAGTSTFSGGQVLIYGVK